MDMPLKILVLVVVFEDAFIFSSTYGGANGVDISMLFFLCLPSF